MALNKPSITRKDVWLSLREYYPKLAKRSGTLELGAAVRERMISMLDLTCPLNHHEEKMIAYESRIFTKRIVYNWSSCKGNYALFFKRNQVAMEKEIFVPEYYEYISEDDTDKNDEEKIPYGKPSHALEMNLRDRSVPVNYNKIHIERQDLRQFKVSKRGRKSNKPNRFQVSRNYVKKKDVDVEESSPSPEFTTSELNDPIDLVIQDFENEGYPDAAYVVERLYENPSMAEAVRMFIDKTFNTVSMINFFKGLN